MSEDTTPRGRWWRVVAVTLALTTLLLGDWIFAAEASSTPTAQQEARR